MDQKSLIRRLEADFEESRENYQKGRCIPLEEFDWGRPFQIAESRTEYRIDGET